MLIAILLGAFFFSAAGAAGAQLGLYFAERIESLPDGPAPHRVPAALLVAASGVIGAIVTPYVATPLQAVILAIVCLALVAIWIVDARRGIVPDVFTLGPLALIFLIAIWQHQWWALLSAAIPFIPFAIAAALSKGMGMGWGDVKLVALGGAVLGAPMAVVAFTLACLAAVAVCYGQGKAREPIAFAPYLAAAIGIGIPFALHF